MSVSVVIINWNSGPLLERCLHSLSLQTLKPDTVFVVDNASSDGSANCVADFSGCRLLLPGSNLGFAAGNNFALRECTSDFVVLLNPDAFPNPDWLETLLAAAESNSEFDVFGSKLINAADSTLLDGNGDAYHISGRVWRTAHGVPASQLGECECEIFSPCAAAALYRRSALLEVGGFDEDFFCYTEDVDLGFRLRLAGYRCLYVPQSVVHHVGSGTTGGQHSDFSVYHGHRNLVWTFVKDMPGLLFWLLLPLHVMLNLVSIVWFALRGQGRVILRAKRDAVSGLPKMWRKRREIQSRRVVSIREVWRLLDKRFIPVKRG